MTCDCGCCDGVHTETPVAIFNPPGRSELSYRVGSHGTFLASMLARLSSRPALAGLTTRDPDDPAIALLDCWAVVGDVLTFYQERIADEGFLRTATEQQSLDQLGVLVGHQPRPPLAASTCLAYTLDPGAQSFIPAGSAVKSVPDQGQLPQTYETSEDLVARQEWNALAVRLTDPPDISRNNVDSTLAGFDVEGTAANLRAGDRLVFQFGADDLVRLVRESTPDFVANRTSVTLVTGPPPDSEFITVSNTLLVAVDAAQNASVVRNGGGRATAINESCLQPLLDRLITDPRPGPDDVLGFASDSGTFEPSVIVTALRRLPEEIALARPLADCALDDWFDGELHDVLTAGAALLTLAAGLTRRSPTEIEELRALARFLVCGCEGGCPPPPPCVDPFQSTALVGMTPILPALRRPPSRPPVNARALGSSVATLFRPDSDVHPKLLIAADPRLAPNLHTAWAKQTIAPPPPLSSVQVMRVKATVTTVIRPTEPPGPPEIWLDAVYDTILPGSPVIIGESGETTILRPDRTRHGQGDVLAPDPGNPNDDKVVGHVTVTVLEFDTATIPESVGKGTPVWAAGDEVTPLGATIPDDVAGTAIDLADTFPGLRPGRFVIVSGERTDVPFTSGVHASELAMVAGVAQRVDPTKPGDFVATTLRLANPLAYTYVRSTITVFGNVVAATQGETRNEPIGSGDSGQANQAFPLRQVLPQVPLTFTPADNPLGAQSSLVTRVNGIEWQATDALALAGPNDHAYAVRSGTDSGVRVLFGDGVHGARLPSGTENVTATYRTGAGASGNVAAAKITQLAAKPLGVNAVTNPLPATGGANGDGPGDARATTALRMLALDRLVSVRDYEDFTRARAGIGKASAVKLFDGTQEVVHVTIAGIGDVPIDPLSGLFTALEAALGDFGDLSVPVRVAVRDLRLIVLSAGVKVLPNFSFDLVEPQIRAALLAEFGFTARDLGRPAFLSAAVAAIQQVPGVDYVDVDVFQGISGDVTPIQLATIVAGLAGAAPCIPSAEAHFEEVVHTVTSKDTLTSIARQFGVTLDELAAANPALADADLSDVAEVVVFRGVKPAQLAVLSADVPETLTLRRIP